MESMDIYQQADGILAISKAAADDGINYLGLDPSRVFVIGTGVGDRFTDNGKSDLTHHPIHTPGVRPEFILTTAGDDYRKNIRRILHAYAILPAQIKERYQLVIVCKMTMSSRESYLNGMKESGYTESPGNILFTGYIPDDQLQILYWHAKLFVFPSFKEGFGLPIVEAVRSGTLPLVGNIAPMSEIVPIEHLQFNPFDPISISQTIMQALSFSSIMHLSLVEKLQNHCAQYNWMDVAKKTLNAYQRVLELPRLPKTSPVPVQRLAIFTLWPPQMSGISLFSARMVKSLLDISNTEIDVFVNKDPSTLDSCFKSSCRILHHGTFHVENARSPYDNIIYCIGNSEHHVYMLPYVFSVPGNVMMHDIRAVDLWWMAAKSDLLGGSHTFCNSMARQDAAEKHSDYRFDELCRSENVETLVDAGLYMASDILRASNHVYTLSKYDAKLAKLFGARSVESLFIPVPHVERNHHAQDDATFWIGVPGLVDPAEKCSDDIIVAFGEVHEKHPETKLVFVGPCKPELESKLLDLLGSTCPRCADSVLFTGELQNSEYQAWLWKISLAVILRKASDSEASNSIVDVIATETPAIVQDIGSFSELEGTVRVVKVGSSSKEIATEILHILDNEDVLQSLMKSCREYASRWTFNRLATTLLDDPSFLSRP
jgi:glycosyltransferase involved in cell wall biosynthesis